MGLKDTYDKAILKSSANVVGEQQLSSYGNAYFDRRLKVINTITGSGLDCIKKQSIGGGASPVFKVKQGINALGTVISIAHEYRGEIQFAIPRDDKEVLLVSVLPPYNSYAAGMPAGKIYSYTGNVDAANERFVEWLATVAPEHSAEIGAILDRIENPPREPVMTL